MDYGLWIQLRPILNRLQDELGVPVLYAHQSLGGFDALIAASYQTIRSNDWTSRTN